MSPRRRQAVKPCENLSRRQREATPIAFASWLIAKVRHVYRVDVVAVLWVMRGSVYFDLVGVDCWDVIRDARTYSGPHPIIAHPPCGPWGKYRSQCGQSKEDGRIAMRLVHQWGGVVEQPLGSSLFREEGEPFRHSIEYVEQCDYGHQAIKPTLLYWTHRPD